MKKFLYILLFLAVGLAGLYIWKYPQMQQFKSMMSGVNQVAETVAVQKDTLVASVDKVMKTIELPMSTTDGSSYIEIRVNGIPMKFLIDSGCNTVSIGYIEYLFLKRQGLVKGLTETSRDVQLADGSNKNSAVIVIDSISIGSATVKNVECMVMTPDSLGNMGDPPLLIGLKTFYKFAKTITMDPERGKITIELK
jgi:clan AA aspartic protease (TIGR02281 family)